VVKLSKLLEIHSLEDFLNDFEGAVLQNFFSV
jgi:hypothetical protein